MIELTKAQEERAQRLHNEAIVIDTHCDTLMAYLPSGGGPRDPSENVQSTATSTYRV